MKKITFNSFKIFRNVVGRERRFVCFHVGSIDNNKLRKKKIEMISLIVNDIELLITLTATTNTCLSFLDNLLHWLHCSDSFSGRKEVSKFLLKYS